ncbi:MAG: hypothetical protein ACKOQM_12610 [Novosphingobium sp.]
MTQTTLPQLTALAKAGAVGRAWALFEDAGFATRTADPAALAVKGRLLKGRARLAAGEERRSLYHAAAEAYGAANLLAPAPYLAINAASLHLLAGDAEGAEAGAAAVLAQLERAALDTPYFLAATRAEAQLLLGNRAEAEAAMADAASADPDGWADRAATIAQLREIAVAQGSAAAWIDKFAPPASLHFAGHMGVEAGGSSEARLRADLAAHFAAHPVGFAWGALAAGADIVIAEALLASGAALHVVLPCPAAQFEAQSVAPAGPDWSRRFARLMDAAATVRIAADSATSVHDPLATALAGDLAIGGALCNAAQLASSAAQLIVCDEAGGGTNTARQAERWRAASGPQYRLTVPRDLAVEALFPPEQPDPARQLAVHLSILHDDLLDGDRLSGAQLGAIAAPVAQALAGLPQGSVRPAPGGWEAAVTDLPAALTAVHKLAELGTVAVGAHLAISPLFNDPASGALVPFGPAPGLARRLAALAQTGTVLASDALAVVLAARGEAPCRAELYYPWEDELGGPVHVLIGQ